MATLNSYAQYVQAAITNKQDPTVIRFMRLFDEYLQADDKHEKMNAFIELVYIAENYGGWVFVNAILGRELPLDADRVRRAILKNLLLRK